LENSDDISLEAYRPDSGDCHDSKLAAIVEEKRREGEDFAFASFLRLFFSSLSADDALALEIRVCL
jgi:hypothetical protein